MAEFTEHTKDEFTKLDVSQLPSACAVVGINVSVPSQSEIASSPKFYPNPTSNHFTIEGLNEPYNLSIYNTIGQLLYQENDVREFSKKVDVSNYPKGILFIRIEAERGIYYQKLIKQ